ncbi:MAG: glycosyltransferase [Saprospiraceae bacterium]
MSSSYDIYVFTTDRDYKENRPYNGVLCNVWINNNNIYSIHYTSPDKQNYRKIKSIIADIHPDFIYINSMFSFQFAILPLIILRRSKFTGKIVLAPRGMLKPSALNYKSYKKTIFLHLFKLLGFSDMVTFQATDHNECVDIKATFGNRPSIDLISNIPYFSPETSTLEKKEGQCTMAFVGRIHPIKGLMYLLNALESVKGFVYLTIYGLIEDESYYDACKKKIDTFNSNIKVSFEENISFVELQSDLLNSHFFVLPTQGENFGHAIFEAMSAGLPVLISDQTPWKDLEQRKIGWDIPLEESDRFKEILGAMVKMDHNEYTLWSSNAKKFAFDYFNKSDIKSQYQKLFN